MDFNSQRTGTGTHEWAEINFNIAKGCPHGCLYCYARANAMRYKLIENTDQWIKESISLKAVNKKWAKKDGIVMFPTTHDITSFNLGYAIHSLTNMLSAGNHVLIVSKPHFHCIDALCRNLNQYKEQILFRFTIGTIDPTVSAFWEPGAPTPDERIRALKYAFKAGFKTSVSMEPMLSGTRMAIKTFYAVEQWVTDTVWIGKMRKIRSRVDMSDPLILNAVEKLEMLQRDEEILRLITELSNEPKVRWKDSIKKVAEEYHVF